MVPSSVRLTRPRASHRWVQVHGGLLLFAVTALAVWSTISSIPGRGDPWPLIGVLAAALASYVAGAMLPHAKRWVGAACVVVAAGALAPVLDVGRGQPNGGPFGYVNTTAAFYMVASAAGLMLAASARNSFGRAIGWIAAVACAAVPMLTRSAAAAVLVVFMPLGTMLATAFVPRALGRLLVAAVILALAVTAALGATFRESGRPAGLERIATNHLTQRRLILWHDALAEMKAHPVFGVGPTRFARFSAAGNADPDARSAHNVFLQQGAETGFVGLVLALVAVLVAITVTVSGRDGFSYIAAGAIASLFVASCIDHVLHASTLSAVALLAGAATDAFPSTRSPRGV